jgi:hypothetical protein
MDTESTATAIVEETPIESAELGADDTTPSGEATEVQEERFIDPRDLPAELQPHWKKMQGAYTKKMQAAAALREQAEQFDALNTDPSTARKFIRERARELGMTVAEANEAQQPTQGVEGIPAEFVEAIRENLEPQLKWLAPSLAKAQWAGVQKMLAPIAQREQAKERETKLQTYQSTAEALTAKAPGWEEHEDIMNDALAYLNSGSLSHPQFPSKLEVLHWIATGQAQGVADKNRRTNAAGRNRTVTGTPGRSEANISEQIRRAGKKEAFGLAAKHALAQLQRDGKLPGTEED